MRDGEVRYERVAGAAVLTIDRPERRNAIDGRTAERLAAGLALEARNAEATFADAAAGAARFAAGEGRGGAGAGA
jgi:enoyl-CoA hydratase